jgi:hypothetical protein
VFLLLIVERLIDPFHLMLVNGLSQKVTGDRSEISNSFPPFGLYYDDGWVQAKFGFETLAWKLSTRT